MQASLSPRDCVYKRVCVYLICSLITPNKLYYARLQQYDKKQRPQVHRTKPVQQNGFKYITSDVQWSSTAQLVYTDHWISLSEDLYRRRDYEKLLGVPKSRYM